MLLFGTCDLCGRNYLVQKKSSMKQGDFLACLKCIPNSDEIVPQAFVIYMPSGRITGEGMLFSDGTVYVVWQDFTEKVAYDTIETFNKELPSIHRLGWL